MQKNKTFLLTMLKRQQNVAIFQEILQFSLILDQNLQKDLYNIDYIVN